ncbi:MAG: hypothetical protein C0522_07615 [Rhodocyclaceae bacterium]|nr:hypothetical protein [Rhodocyclaceae bacterium]
MATKPRQKLTGLTGLLATKPNAAPLAPAGLDPEAQGAPVRKERDSRVQVLVRMTPAERKALRRVALDQDTTVQALVEDALRDLLRRHGA